ncbi:Oidioi.mRNA.OKI2018_I69.chr1.g1090.t1.cds [Oikopleura dioica]|uniref:Oidioi.mRNA.OKI2018_I69.chr1.g1090.t1.cds n=1 Tax=Oikopleura dioica TaxID=34765 RepID=A0ABN7STZ1_OIKDI|nr:Oidioi.mRNA.OKI2018_I69.chr1.g1090.t1.cds [Oikopleura dioica]
MTVTVENEEVLKRKKTKRGKKKPASAKNATHKKPEKQASQEKKEKLAKTSFLTELGGHCLLQSIPCLVGDYVCAITGDAIRVYSVYTSDFVASLTGHTDTVTSIIPHPTQPLSLISSSLDGTIRIWSVDDFALLRTIRVSKDEGVNAVKATEKELHLIVNGGYARIPFPESSERTISVEPKFIFADILKERINKNGGVDRQWSLNGKGSKIAFLVSPKFMKIISLDSLKSKKVSFTFKDGQADKLDYHPREESVLVSFSSGKNIVYSNLLETSSNKAAKEAVTNTVFHWHQGRDDAVDQGGAKIEFDACYSTDGVNIMSGGAEAVFLVENWKNTTDSNSRAFIPRLNAPVVWVANFGEWTLLSLADNSIQLVNHMSIKHTISGFTKNVMDQYEAGLSWDPNTDAIVANSRPGMLQMYSLERNKEVSRLDVTRENIVFQSGFFSSASSIVLVDIFEKRMVTVERKTTTMSSQRDTIRLWTHEGERWIDETHIVRAHVGNITHIQLLNQKCFITAGSDGKLKKWEEIDGRWITTHIGGYRNEAVRHFDVSEDQSIVASISRSKCVIYASSNLAFTDTLLPPVESSKGLTRVYFCRGDAKHNLLVGKKDGYYLWDLITCSLIRIISNKNDSTFWKIWRHPSMDIFVSAEKSKSETRLRIFAGASGKIKTTATTKKDILSAHIFSQNKIVVLAKGGSLLKLSSKEEVEELQKKCEPEMRVQETKMMTPVGGMLKVTAPVEEVQVAEKLVLSSDKLRELLYLPAYLLPKATDFAGNLLNTLLEANELSTRQNELARAKTAPKEDAEPMEIDEKNENSDDETSEPLINLKPKEEEVTRVNLKKLGKLKNLEVTAKFG